MRSDVEVTIKHFSSDRVRCWICMALVGASFFIYATAILILHEAQRNDFVPERSSIAAAVSNLVYGAPMGTVYSGVVGRLLEMSVPLDRTLPEVAAKQVAPGELIGVIKDGNGIGYVIVTSLSMRLFGLHVSSSVK